MKEKELIKELAEETTITQKQIKEILDLFKEKILTGVIKTKEIKLNNFGKFSLIDQAERKGRNPKTGKNIIIKARKKLKFSPFTKTKELLNK